LGADVIAEYGDDFYKGMPVVTKNTFGKGEAWYIASSPDANFLLDFTAKLSQEKGVEPLLESDEGDEVSERVKDGQAYLFVMNHNHESRQFYLEYDVKTDIITGKSHTGSCTIAGNDVMILT